MISTNRLDGSQDTEVVEVDAPAPGAAVSGSHHVRVNGTPVFVERFADLSYVRIAMRGSVAVEIEVADPIADHALFPAGRAASAYVAANVLTFKLPAPESVVVWIDSLEKLVLLPDPIEGGAPVPGSPGVFDVTDFGADPTGATLATTALQAALDEAASRPGGGTMFIPRGVFRTGTLTLGSNITLYLAAGALLQGSPDPADYPLDPGRHESGPDESLPPDARYLGRTMTFSRLLLVDRAQNVRIAGRGTIDGEGAFLRKRHHAVPNLLRIRESSGVVIEDVLFRNAAAWSIHVFASHHVAFRNVKVINDRGTFNTDGIDPDMSTDVTIDCCFVSTKDDAICIKATGNSELSGDPRRIRVTNNLVSSLDAALKLGSESEARSFSDITRSTSSQPNGRPPATSAAVAPETSTWSPWPIASRRATRFSVGPKKSLSRTSALPEWSAIRTRRRPVSGQSCPSSARWPAMAAVTADSAWSKAASSPSPVVLKTAPPASSTAERSSASWAARATTIASRRCSQRRALPSISVIRKVAVRDSPDRDTTSG